MEEEPLNAVQVASLLHVGRNKVYEMARTGELPSYRIGRKLLFSPWDVQAFVESRRSAWPGSASSGSGASCGEAPETAGGKRVVAQGALQGGPRAMQQVASCAPAIGQSECYLAGLLQAEPAEFAIAGEGVVSALALDALSRAGVSAAAVPVNGYAGLVGMYLGQVDATLLCLYDAKANSYNAPFAQRLAPGVPVVSVCLGQRLRGFAVAPGNPKKITTWGGLLREGVRLAQQERGSASRVLLDGKLAFMEARVEHIAGYEGVETDGFAAARQVAAGLADVAVCTEREAASSGAEFVFMQEERVDFVVKKSARTRNLVRAAKKVFADDGFREQLARAGDMQTRRTGSVVYES